jgi:cyanophycinase
MRWLLALWALALAAAAPAAAPSATYDYHAIGRIDARTPHRPEAGLLLMGGGGWSHDALRWFFAKAGNGHIVILRASGGADAGEEMYRDIGGIASAETLVFHSRAAASDKRALDVLARADGIFIAGGDQSNYVRFWKNTPVGKALNAHVARGKPIGGTSAGLAILGGAAYGAMDGGSIDSRTALADPLGPAVTIVRDFLRIPLLAHIVTDTHFAARDRLGRLVAFVAQVRARYDPRAVGLGVDEKSALCVEANGMARLYTPDGGHAWLVEPEGQPLAAPGRPLGWRAVRITGIGPDGSLDLRTLKVTRPAFSVVASVEAGRLVGAPEGRPRATATAAGSAEAPAY